MNTPLYFYYSGKKKKDDVVQTFKENAVKQNCIPKGIQSLSLSDFLNFYLFIQMHIILILISKMEQYAFLKISFLKETNHLYRESLWP